MPRFALGLSYDGSPWQGWQTQPHGRTLQDYFQKAVRQFTVEPVKVVCAGRTDTGVHALEQVVHLDTPVERSLESWVRALNSLLPPSIAVNWVQPVSTDFHARFSATARTYLYVLHNSRVRSPLMHERVGQVFYPLDLELMQQAAQRFTGVLDFSSFRASECQAASPIRNLQHLQIVQRGDFFIFTFKANAFLHHMVRNLVGTLVYVGLERLTLEGVTTLLKQRDRRFAPPTFSPSGLYLARVDYPEKFGLPQISTQVNFAANFGFV